MDLETMFDVVAKDNQMRNELARVLCEFQNILLTADLDETLAEDIKKRAKVKHDLIDKHKYDLLEGECPIVVLGEVSSGKSSFLNLFLGDEVLPKSALAKTSFVCRLRRNTDDKKCVILANEKEEVIREKVFENATVMRDYLDRVMSDSIRYSEVRYVDIFWPCPILQNHFMFVDTPGIGTSIPEEKEGIVYERLFEYLPKSVACLFIINSSNDGGIQSDRVQRLFKALSRRDTTRSDEEYVPFQISNTLFICNKWDLIEKEEAEKVYQHILSKVQLGWPSVDLNKVLTFSVRKELKFRKKSNKITSMKFEEIQKNIYRIVPESLEQYIWRHFCWIQAAVKRTHSQTQILLRSQNLSKEERESYFQKLQQNLIEQKKDTSQVKFSLVKEVNARFYQIAEELREHLTNKVAIDRIVLSIPHPDNLSSVEEAQLYYGREIIMRIVVEKKSWCDQRSLSTIWKDIVREWREKNSDIGRYDIPFQAQVSVEEPSIPQAQAPAGDVLLAMKRQIKKQGKDRLFSKAEAIGLAFTAPLWLPLVVGASVLALPIGLGTQISQYRESKNKLTDFLKNRETILREWTESIINENESQDKIFDTLERTHVRDFIQRIGSLESEELLHIDVCADTIDEVRSSLDQQTTSIQKLSAFCYEMSKLKEHLKWFKAIYFGNKFELKECSISVSGEFGQEVRTKEGEYCYYGTLFMNSFDVKISQLEKLRSFDHVNIQKLQHDFITITEDKKHLLLRFESCGETLHHLVLTGKAPTPLSGINPIDVDFKSKSWTFFSNTITGICRGVQYLHESGMPHGNLSLSSIKMSRKTPKLCNIKICINQDANKSLRNPIRTDVANLGYIKWEMWYGRCLESSDFGPEETVVDLSEQKLLRREPNFYINCPLPRLEDMMMNCWSENEADVPSPSDVARVVLSCSENKQTQDDVC